jgi:hypothetical protein
MNIEYIYIYLLYLDVYIVQPELCPAPQIIATGTCGPRGGYECALEFLRQKGASGMPQKCTCQPASKPDTRLCNCRVLCRE